MNTRSDKDFICPEPNPAEEAMLREESLHEEPPKMTQAEKDAALATRQWLIRRLAWAATAKGNKAKVTRYRIVSAILRLMASDEEILNEVELHGIHRETARYHLDEYKFKFRKLRKS